ncbi:MAG TPA: DUF1579 domain-containing protein [Vicinamibacterales bacterium]|nr:DUF1579 domain-containing protein [Vicinamibacterales bacterium]
MAAAASGVRAQQKEMPMPKPGPEHALLKDDVGTWDAVVEMFGAPGAPPMKSKGVETNTLGCAGLCLITDFKGEMGPGTAFEGHGVSTWDPAKKKFVGVWTDSMSFGLGTGESTWDSKTRTVTGYMEGADQTGKVMKMKSVVQYKGADTRIFTMYGPPEGGKETVTMTITYTRRR